MKILLVTHGYPPELAAGSERVVERLARSLRARGHGVFVITGTFEPRPRVEIARREQDGILIYQIHRDDLYFDRWEKTYHPGVSKAILQILEDARPDVVHAHHFIRLSRDAVHLATLARVPAVLTLHDFVTTCLIGFRAPGAGRTFCDIAPNDNDCIPCAGTAGGAVPLAPRGAFALLRADLQNELSLARAVCAVSNAQREKLAAYHNIPAERFEVVPLAPVADLPRGAPAPEPPPLRVATWGIQMERKGAHILIEAAARFAGAVEVDIFGRFDHLEYERRCRALASGLPFRFHGRFEWDVLAATRLHAAVFPSLTFETFGLTFDEAWALGHPVIATDLGAYRERADDATILFRAGDAGELAKIFEAFLNDTGRLAHLRAAVVPPPGFERYVSDMEKVYVRAAAAGAPALDADRFDASAHSSEAEFAAREAEFRRLLSM